MTMSEKQQPADASWPICPECGHEDPDLQLTGKVGDSSFMFCSQCHLAWHWIIVGSCYIGELGHGRVYPMGQNRRLKVDSEGNLRTVPPEKE